MGSPRHRVNSPRSGRGRLRSNLYHRFSERRIGDNLFMGAQTNRIRVGTFVANIYLRHSYVCAQATSFIAEVTSGRMILGLGVSHRVVNTQLGISMGAPLPTLRTYVADVQNWLRGDGPAFLLPRRPLPVGVPIYIAALSSKAVEQGTGAS